MRYFKVSCQRGHVGTRRAGEITFYFKANNLLEAMTRARWMPSVKHHATNAISSAVEVSAEEYFREIKKSAYEKAERR